MKVFYRDSTASEEEKKKTGSLKKKTGSQRRRQSLAPHQRNERYCTVLLQLGLNPYSSAICFCELSGFLLSSLAAPSTQ